MGYRVNPQDYIGLKFGNWIVKGYIENKGSATMMLCVCECGNCNGVEKYVKLANLRSGRSKSCGTNQRHCLGRKSGNKYKFAEYCVTGYTSDGSEFYIDIEDYELVKQYTWCLLGKNDKYGNYVMTNYSGGKLFLHNLLMNNVGKEFVIDHKDGNPLNNRRCNLRESSQINNMKNRKIPTNNTSGVKGVHWNKLENKWVAYITCNKKHIHLGYFNDYDNAVKTRRDAEIEYFKEYKREEKYE